MRFGCEFAIFGSKDDEAGYRQIDLFQLEELCQKTDVLIQLDSGVFHDGFFSSRINPKKFRRLFIEMELAVNIFGLEDDCTALSEQQAIHLYWPVADFQADVPKDLEFFLQMEFIELFLQPALAPFSGSRPVELPLKKRPLRMRIFEPREQQLQSFNPWQ